MMNAAASTEDRAAPVAEQGADVAPEKASSKKVASQKKGAPKGQKAATKVKRPARKKAPKKETKPAKMPDAKAATAAREGSKKSIILELLRRPKGATMSEISKATAWQAHSIRGYISGTLGKKMGFTIESSKNNVGERTYRAK